MYPCIHIHMYIYIYIYIYIEDPEYMDHYARQSNPYGIVEQRRGPISIHMLQMCIYSMFTCMYSMLYTNVTCVYMYIYIHIQHT